MTARSSKLTVCGLEQGVVKLTLQATKSRTRIDRAPDRISPLPLNCRQSPSFAGETVRTSAEPDPNPPVQSSFTYGVTCPTTIVTDELVVAYQYERLYVPGPATFTQSLCAHSVGFPLSVTASARPSRPPRRNRQRRRPRCRPVARDRPAGVPEKAGVQSEVHGPALP